MPRFSQASFSQLSTCHIDLQTIFYEVIKYIDCRILEGHRNQVAQDKAYDEGNSTLKWPDGKHNKLPSLAVDVAPYPMPAWEKIGDFIYFAGFVMGIAAKLRGEGKITHGVRYGGDWNKNYRITDEKGLKDFLHFELIA